MVDDQMNEALCAPFTGEEIRCAVFDMHPSKAPGPDGFTALFYQKLWPIEGENVIAAALSLLNDRGDPSEWNTTLITLISKFRTQNH